MSSCIVTSFSVFYHEPLAPPPPLEPPPKPPNPPELPPKPPPPPPPPQPPPPKPPPPQPPPKPPIGPIHQEPRRRRLPRPITLRTRKTMKMPIGTTHQGNESTGSER